MPETRTYRRSELYEQVWARPMREVAKDYGVSDVALAKTCRKLGVPLPGAGHWARVQAGHKVRQPPLSPLPPGAPEVLTVTPPSRDAGPELSSEASEAVAALLDHNAAIIVPARLTDPHVLVAETQLLYSGAQPPRGAKLRFLNIAVSKEARPRALRIMDALLKALEARGLPVEVTEDRGPGPNGYTPSKTRVRIMDQWVCFRLVERVRARLALQVPDPQYGLGKCEWIDGKRLRLEDRLNEFLAALYEKADLIREREAGYARARQEREEEARRRLEAQREAEEDQRRATEFEETIRRWRLARDIRTYVKEVHDMVTEAKCHLRPEGGLHKTLEWGLSYADRIDPLTPLAKELAEHVAKGQEGLPPSTSDASPPGSREPDQPEPTTG